MTQDGKKCIAAFEKQVCKWQKLQLSYDIERKGTVVVIHIHIKNNTNKLTHRFEFDLDDPQED